MADIPVFNPPAFVAGAVNLASARLGAQAVWTTDEFFAPLSRALNDDPAKWDENAYDDNGKWMDGWESRRKRVPGHDIAVVKLAMPGRIRGFDVDTSYFTGNFPPHCSIEAAYAESGDPDPANDALWTEILPKSPLGSSAHHFFENADTSKVWTHVRLHIYPDGGVARLRVYGDAHFDWTKVGADQEIDLAYIFHGAKALAWSNAHYGLPEKVLGPGRGINMGDGWETARRRGPGHDWAIIKLGHRGTVSRAIIDTHFFKGNYPDTCEILAAHLPDAPESFSEADIAASESWKPLMPRTKLQMDEEREFKGDALTSIGPVTHVRLAMFPDGGIMRMRLFGKKA